MSEQNNSRRQFLIASTGLVVAAGCGAQETGGGGPNQPIGDPEFYPNPSRMPAPPMDNNMPLCPSTGGLIAGPQASTLSVNQAVRVSGNLYVGRDSEKLFAVNITCTHAGCTPALNSSSQNWVCGCHGSTFALDGALLKGPATRPLPRYAVCKGSDGRLYIDMSKMI